MKHSGKFIAIVVLVIVLDQLLKIFIKTHFAYGESVLMFGWEKARLHFVENEGMAFGLSFGGSYGKLFLSLFRIFVVGWLIYYIRLLMKAGASFGLLVSFALILAGALGNIIDSAFYGLIFSDSVHSLSPATLFPEGGGYAPFLHGRVVDMFYFPLFSGHFPDWVPMIGGNPFTFFRPVFNLADAAISIGVFSLIIFQRSFFVHQDKMDSIPQSLAREVTVDSNEQQSPSA